MTKYQKLMMVFGLVGIGVATGCATVGMRDDVATTDPTPLAPGDVVEDTETTAEASHSDEPEAANLEADADTVDDSAVQEDVAVEEDAGTEGDDGTIDSAGLADDGEDTEIADVQDESDVQEPTVAEAEPVDEPEVASVEEETAEVPVEEFLDPVTDENGSGGLRTSQAGIDIIKAYEGLRLEAYVGPDGGTYIGYGHAEDVYMGMTITEETAEALLKQDLVEIEDAIKALVTVPINENELSGMVSLAYNIGIFAFTDSTVLRQLNNGDRVAAGDAFMMWNKINEGGGLVENEQLTERRQTERALFLTPPGEDTIAPISGRTLKDRELSQR